MKYYNEETENKKIILKDLCISRIEELLMEDEIDVSKVLMYTKLTEILDK